MSNISNTFITFPRCPNCLSRQISLDERQMTLYKMHEADCFKCGCHFVIMKSMSLNQDQFKYNTEVVSQKTKNKKRKTKK